MKSPFLIFFIACFVVISVVILPSTTQTLLEYNFESEEVNYCFYTENFTSKTDNTYVLKSGVYDIVCCKYKNANSVKNKISNMLFGESLNVKNATQNDINNIKNYANCHKKIHEYFDDFEIYYCYDIRFPKFVIVNDKKINVQIAISTSDVTMGYPIILGEY